MHVSLSVLMLTMSIAMGTPVTSNQTVSSGPPAPDNRKFTPVPRFVLNLDLPARERWSEIITNHYQSEGPSIIDYLKGNIPEWAMPIIQVIGKDIRPYFHDYAEEMEGIAEAFGLEVGYIVDMNLVYQLESIGINCSNWNNTGPTVPDDPGCRDIDPRQDYCYCHNKSNQEWIDPHTSILQPPKYRTKEAVTGLCTSVVANTPEGAVLHGRNLDWNIPPILRKFVIDVDYQRGNKTVFRGTTIAGFVGILNGMAVGESDRWSISMDARGKGGKILPNIAAALLRKSMTPTQLMRKALETIGSYSEAISPGSILNKQPMVDDAYFIIAGSLKWEGGVMSRARKNAIDYWAMNTTDSKGWYRLQTNYDHWNPVPVADDRRTPGRAHMDALGPSKITSDSIYQVMTTEPTYNFHTDYTAVMEPQSGLYMSGVWL